MMLCYFPYNNMPNAAKSTQTLATLGIFAL